ncbi:hypothetical protein PL81_41065 [Streptomyces sp. RSD-27]|nr:hypothetical protein PL81_41065 [Streptomyces sp. RSD-27]
MVAAWDPFVDDPARSANMTISDLALLLDTPVFAMRGRKPPLHVYDVAVRNGADDRILSDEEWAEVGRWKPWDRAQLSKASRRKALSRWTSGASSAGARRSPPGSSCAVEARLGAPPCRMMASLNMSGSRTT